MTRARNRENARLVIKIGAVVLGAVIASACANDFDALFDKSDAKSTVDSGKSSSSGTSGDVVGNGDDDDVPLPDKDAGDKPLPTECSAKTCTATTTSADKDTTVLADQCCTYDTTCTPSGFGTTCSMSCTNGAVCSGDCRAGDCNYAITGSSLNSDCKGAFCALKCTAKSKCAITCDATDGCDVACDDSSQCVVSNCFGGGGFCKVRCAGGVDAESCGNGIRACGGCPK